MTEERQAVGRRNWNSRTSTSISLATFALLSAFALVWILGTAPSGGPDEPVHVIRGAALVRGELGGERFAGRGRIFELPAWVGYPNHGCFSLRPEQPANCAPRHPLPDGDALLVTTSTSYPVWGHLAPGLATFFPAAIGNELARLFDAAIPIALLAAGLALAARRSRFARAAGVLAVTPMVWFSIIVVNPSGLAIAGGFALWTALLSVGRTSVPASASATGASVDRLVAWTLAAGWAAAVLPRRDSMIWAALIVAVVAASGIVDLRRMARGLGVGPLVVIASSTLATIVWAFTSDTSSSMLLVAAPFLPVVGDGVHRMWSRNRTAVGRSGIVAAAVLAAVAAASVAVTRRSGGWDADLMKRVIGQSGPNLREAIGVLGWLDTPIPRTALFLWLIALGVVIGIVLATRHSADVVIAATVVVLGVVGAWVLEMSQGNDSGTYWQGRYYLPMLVGVPLILGWSRSIRTATSDVGDTVTSDVDDMRERTQVGDTRERVQTGVVVGVAMILMTMAFAQSMRRWGVGISGSMLPWDWNTYDTRLPPWVLLVMHIALGVLVTYCVTRRAAFAHR